MSDPTHAPAEPWPAPHATGPVDATVALPGSKSLTNRALVLAALADGPGVVRRALRSRDTELMAAALTALGAEVDTTGDDWKVTPGPLARRRHHRLRPGRHGDAVRAAGGRPRRRPGHLRRRPARPQPAHGTRCSRRSALSARPSTTTAAAPCRSPWSAPGRCAAARSPSTPRRRASSSPRCCSPAPRYEQGVDVRHDGQPVPSLPHIEMTVDMLRQRGVEVDDSDAEPLAGAPRPGARGAT